MLNQYIKERSEEFDKEFLPGFNGEFSYVDVPVLYRLKSFHLTSLLGVIEVIEQGVEKIKDNCFRPEDFHCGELSKHETGQLDTFQEVLSYLHSSKEAIKDEKR